MSTFAELGLGTEALEGVARLGYDEPTPVQEQAIPLILEGRDVIAAASTGTGKTAAFLLPALSMLPPSREHGRAPRVLVITPTRELAQQIAHIAMKIARATGHYVATAVGGVPYGAQVADLRRGADVLVAVPGRLRDLMSTGAADVSAVETLVLDEADRMLDMGFLPDVSAIVEATPAARQTLLFSATVDKSIERNLGSLLRDPVMVEITKRGATAQTVAQYMIPCTQKQKPELLRAVLDEKGSRRVIVFARTRDRADDLAAALRKDGYYAEAIHSNLTQAQRRKALENFRKGETDLLVATDVLARGIDVEGVHHVINYDLPDMAEDYVHRIGRTGRAGEEGYAITFATPDTRRLLREVERLIGREIPLMKLRTFESDLRVLKQGQKHAAHRSGGGATRGAAKGPARTPRTPGAFGNKKKAAASAGAAGAAGKNDAPKPKRGSRGAARTGETKRNVHDTRANKKRRRK